jgi:hypothetical protein
MSRVVITTHSITPTPTYTDTESRFGFFWFKNYQFGFYKTKINQFGFIWFMQKT